MNENKGALPVKKRKPWLAGAALLLALLIAKGVFRLLGCKAVKKPEEKRDEEPQA